MTREDFTAALETLGSTVDLALYLERVDEILRHDAEQRTEIEQLQAQLATAKGEVLEAIKAEVKQNPYTYCARSDDRYPESILVEWIDQQKEAL